MTITELKTYTHGKNEVAIHIETSYSTRTIEAAKEAFDTLKESLESIGDLTLLPDDLEVQEDESSSEESSESHWSERIDPKEELDRLEKPSLNAVRRLVYLTTIQPGKLPYAEEDLQAFVISNQTRQKTYRWFKLGMVPFLALSAIQGFASVIAPSTEPRDNASYYQGTMITVASTCICALGILFTGLHPDVSQDKLNEKVDRLNRVKEKLDEVARTLIIFCFHKDQAVRILAQTAASELNIGSIEIAATHSNRYAITSTDIEPSLTLLRQAVRYVNNGTIPEDHALNMLIQTLLKRKLELASEL